MREGERQVWTDDELDRALVGLYTELKPQQRGLAGAREKLMAGMTGEVQPRLSTVETGESVRRRRPLRRWLAAAAAVVVLATGGVVALAVLFSSATAAAQEALTSAADITARAEDPVLSAGQYRYVATHAWWMTTGAENKSRGSGRPQGCGVGHLRGRRASGNHPRPRHRRGHRRTQGVGLDVRRHPEGHRHQLLPPSPPPWSTRSAPNPPAGPDTTRT